MNFLAHLFLSGFDDEQMMVGNFIADSIKGRQILEYPEGVQRGILLHREIDHFTDTHDVVSQTKQRFVPIAGHYAGVVVDLAYDYCLSINWARYSDQKLSDFNRRAYVLLLKHWFAMPNQTQSFLAHFISSRRLSAYCSTDGIADTIVKMSRETSMPDVSHEVKEILEWQTRDISLEFNRFFPEILDHISAFRSKL